MGWDVSRRQIPGIWERYRPRDLLEGGMWGIREGGTQGNSRTFSLRNPKEGGALSWGHGKEGCLMGREIRTGDF